MKYRILILGDSVAWGQGLIPHEKFSAKLGKYIHERIRRQVEIIDLSHSGAVIGLKPIKPGGLNRFLYGELPSPNPNVLTQIKIAAGKEDYLTYLDESKYDPDDFKIYKSKQKKRIQDLAGKSPDLVVVCAGINDIGAEQVALPWEQNADHPDPFLRILDGIVHSASELEELTESHCGERMLRLLKEVFRNFKETSVIVCGYYPLVTKGNDSLRLLLNTAAFCFAGLSPITLSLGASLIVGLGGFGVLAKRSAHWVKYSDLALRRAVHECNSMLGQNQCHFISPSFGPNDGTFASSAKLFGLKLSDYSLSQPLNLDIFSPYDPRAGARKRAYDYYYKATGNYKNDKFTIYRASAFHPNVEGADKYVQSIIRELVKNSTFDRL